MAEIVWIMLDLLLMLFQMSKHAFDGFVKRLKIIAENRGM